MTRRIPLTRGAFAVVDDEDYAALSEYNWYLTHFGYAARAVWTGHRTAAVWLHREIVGARVGEDVDHADHDKLNNRRANLRICTRSQNQQNRLKSSLPGGRQPSSQYKGVSWFKSRKKWAAYIKQNGKRKHLGYFATEREAALAYDSAARQLFGEFAYLNFPDEEGPTVSLEKRQTSSRHVGVSFDNKTGRWRAYIDRDGTRRWLGFFDREIDAIQAREREV